jgi:hypothetical protein
MIPDATFEPVEAPSKLRIRFSLLALLLFVTLVCILLAWWVQPDYVVATALFRVSSMPPSILDADGARPFDEREFEILKKTQVALLKSDFVLTSALRKPGIAGLPVFAGQADPVEWLQDHLEIDFPENGEILSISLRGTDAQANDLVVIVDSVAKAYDDEVLTRDKQRRLAQRDLLARSLENLKHEIVEQWDEFLDIARESGRPEGGAGKVRQELDIGRLDRIEKDILRLEEERLKADRENTSMVEALDTRIAQLRARQSELEKLITKRGEISVELSMRQQELDRIQRIANEMEIKLEKMDIEAQVPPRIEKVQPAVISRDD